ncbi:trypsin-like peptidase domain-containing protein [Nonomuraea sp. NPDC050383]|uniref:trypsin-like peptidase domain-containing protein n=1 Tax=Nonomuraea sp. NPDC050383 TaxID=3364362 RepID=UPI0037965173
MTDEKRPGEGRMPSDFPVTQGRPEFLPADGQADRPGGGPGAPSSGSPGSWEPPSSSESPGAAWGSPAFPDSQGAYGRPEGPQEPYGSQGAWRAASGHPGDVPVFGAPQGPYGGPSPSFGASGDRGDRGGEAGDGVPFQAASGDARDASDAGPGGDAQRGRSPYEPSREARQEPGPEGQERGQESGQEGGAPGEPPFGRPDAGDRPFGRPDGPDTPFGRPDSGDPSFGRADDSPFGRPDGGDPPHGRGDAGEASFGAEGGSSTRAYDSPFFGPSAGPAPYGGDTPPPPPRHALGMGPGWAPPPPGGGVAAAPRRGPGIGVLVALAVVIALVASALGSIGTYLLTRSNGTDPTYSLGPAPTGATNRAPDSVAGVAARVLPSVVSLEVGNGSNTEGATGSGFLIKNGYVVTNNHVVAMAAKGGEIKIMFYNRKTTTGRIVGRDPGSDLAVVKPEDTFGTPEINLGNSDQVVVGDPVIAVGSPLGLSGTVTTGIVSSLNRPVIAGDESGGSEEPAYISAIQTDAAINPGNSGGPLVNGKGEVVGVNSAIATLSRSLTNQSGSIGLGFAIPVNQARRVAEELVTSGKAKRPKIGIVLDPDYKGQGVRIASEPAEGRQPVDPGGPAAKAGLKAGDVILELDGLRLQDGNELIALVRSKSPGSHITVKYQRAGQERTATLTVTADAEPAPTPS